MLGRGTELCSSTKARKVEGGSKQSEGKVGHADTKACFESPQQGCILGRGNGKKGLKRKQIPNQLGRKERHCFPKV